MFKCASFSLQIDRDMSDVEVEVAIVDIKTTCMMFGHVCLPTSLVWVVTQRRILLEMFTSYYCSALFGDYFPQNVVMCNALF